MRISFFIFKLQNIIKNIIIPVRISTQPKNDTMFFLLLITDYIQIYHKLVSVPIWFYFKFKA